MASTSSLGAQSSTSSSQAQVFYEEFNKSLREIREAIAESKTEGKLGICFDNVAKARNELTAVTEQLPPYDRLKHEQRLKEVNELLSQKRASLVPRSRFAFKRKPKVVKVEGGAEASAEETIAKPQKEVEDPSKVAASAAEEEDEEKKDFLSIEDRKGQYITLDDLCNTTAGKGSDLHLLNIQDCFIDLRQGLRFAKNGEKGDRDRGDLLPNPFLALQVRNLHRCVIFCGTINGSTMIHDCSECLLSIECKQFRMHSSLSMAILIATKSVATIEHCKKLQFAPLSTNHQDGIVPRIQDFGHIHVAQPSTSWSLMGKNSQQAIQEAMSFTTTTSSSSPHTDVNKILRTAGITTGNTQDTPLPPA